MFIFYSPVLSMKKENERMTMEIVRQKIAIDELESIANKIFGNLVKAVVDVSKRIMAIDGELHSDEEALLLENGSKQNDLWGINLYPEFGKGDPDFIEFDSMINLRPSQKNFSRSVDDENIRGKIIEIVNEWIV